MGKPFAQAKGEVAKCAVGFRWFAEHAEAHAGRPGGRRSTRRSGSCAYQPLGAVLAVMPWNFPLWQVVRFARPGRHGRQRRPAQARAERPPDGARSSRTCSAGPGLPDGVLQTLLVGTDQVPARHRRPTRVAAVTLTGSVGPACRWPPRPARPARRSSSSSAARDPFIVLPSADLDRAVPRRPCRPGCRTPASRASPPSGSSSTRDVADEFTERFVAAMAALSVGDPFDPATEVGPLINAAAVDAHRGPGGGRPGQGGDHPVRRPPGGGPRRPRPARVLLRPDRAHRHHARACGWPPRRSSGPSPSSTPWPTPTRPSTLANDTEFGLGSSVWTDDPDEQQQFVAGLQAGQVFVNGMTVSMPAAALRRHQDARASAASCRSFGLHEFCNVKSVWIA